MTTDFADKGMVYDIVQLLVEPEPESVHVAEFANLPPAEPSFHDMVPVGVVGLGDVSVIVALKTRLDPVKVDAVFGIMASVVVSHDAYMIGFVTTEPVKTAPHPLLNIPLFIRLPVLVKIPWSLLFTTPSWPISNVPKLLVIVPLLSRTPLLVAPLKLLVIVPP